MLATAGLFAKFPIAELFAGIASLVGCASETCRAQTATERLSGAVDHHDLDRRGNVRKADDGIARPVAAGDARLLPRHGLVTGPADRLDDPALDLVADARGVARKSPGVML